MPLPLVLIVDDNPQNLSVVGELLLPQHAVRVANSGQRALQLARLQPQPDLVLLDVMMPGMDGFAVLQALRADPATATIPVILLTALDSAEDEERGLLLGAADYITKPVRPGVLLARVAMQLALRALARQYRSDRQQLQDQVAQLQTALRVAQDGTLQTLRHLLEAGSPEAGRHTRRLQAHLRSLCRAMRRDQRFSARLDDRQVDLLSQAAPLHDLGLLTVPAQVLDKPGPLDDAERALMQGHAVAGADALDQAAQAVRNGPGGHQGPDSPGPVTDQDALDSLAWLPLARQIARHHHERWDGAGYPDGLAGDAIPWPARLLALVDTYDGLTSARPYRPALSHAEASAVILAERGRQFDPDVVDAFVECGDDWPAMARRHG